MALMTVEEALVALQLTPPNGRIIYHEGDLATDRAADGELDDLATLLYGLGAPAHFVIGGEEGFIIYGQGKGYLTQQRLSDNHYLYIYTKGSDHA